MSMNDTPSSERLHIGIFGRRNAGKSSLINALTGQELAIVSPQKGTTTDPVYKAMELLPLGPVVLIDTPGLDDEGELGQQRVRKAHQVLNKTDLAVLVVDCAQGLTPEDEKIRERILAKGIPLVIVLNKADCGGTAQLPAGQPVLAVSCLNGTNIQELKELLARQIKSGHIGPRLLPDLVQTGDLLVLVVPVDSSAPKGRLILPQQQVIRALLDIHAAALVVQDTELKTALAALSSPPRMVVTDSQAFARVAADTPQEVMLTSFSILFARYKGDLPITVQGAGAIASLPHGARVLISEGCTHHRQCADIGTVKMPHWLEQYTGRKFDYTFSSGTEFPDDLTGFDLIIHCGACMLNEREVKYRLQCARDQGVPMTNYGIAIAQMHGILKRSLQPFPDLARLLQE
ncbi:MAG: [FeFe] hydrogenase H-cluster maturation GTPase HydF [Oligosphaeraceae bacterium]|nr:[FeFe] hydrogenase H-cluster maturation GTPase HydF [Oligosphaeraceae bacterium]